MKILLSPTKNLSENTVLKQEISMPIYEKEASQLISDLKRFNTRELQDLTGISLDLAQQNMLRFKNWKKASLHPGQAISAVEMFHGEVYRALDVQSFSDIHLLKLSSDLRILSGLYGILKPFDQIYPHRLEMGTKFSSKVNQKNLYEFWGAKVTKALKKELMKDEVVVNLASSEYAKVIQAKLIKNRIITPVFKEYKNGNYSVVMMYAKHARGAMTRYLIEHSLGDINELKMYNIDGYQYEENLSTEDQWVFTR